LIKAILFDLDGTLLDVDMDVFLQHYFKKLASHCAPYMNPQEFVHHLLSATRAMMENRDPGLTNREVFWHHFTQNLSVPPENLIPHIEEFYRNVFPTLKEHTQQFPAAAEIMKTAESLNCVLVLATNPVFPLAAIRHRLNWAGLNEERFALITSYETMHACKPHPEYYLEIAEKMDVNPGECLMIGNDADDDIQAAKKAGMKTYLATNLLVNKSGKIPEPDYTGMVEDIPQLLGKLITECE
jgi:HAD superfamily hydrolase (TIGR01549 family)